MKYQKSVLATLILAASTTSLAQNEIEEVVVTGIRASLANALDQNEVPIT